MFVLFLFLFFFFFVCENIDQADNEQRLLYNKTVNFLLKATIQGLLVETPEVLGVQRSKNVARFFPPLFQVRSCQVELFVIPCKVLPS